MTLCSLVLGYPEDGGNRFLQYASNHLHDMEASMKENRLLVFDNELKK
jgi:hypothetical protein